MALFIPDSGDKYDIQKTGTAWDFPENGPVFWIKNYPYKASTKQNAIKLSMIRDKINILCQNIINDTPNWPIGPKESIDGINVFLGLHNEYYYDPKMLPSPFYEIAKKGLKTSRYLLSEIPKGTMFDGLSKPRMRYLSSEPKVGPDARGRALYRDIFLNLNKKDNIQGSEKGLYNGLKGLVIHELAHSLANHIQYRPDDHHEDFKWAEKFITIYWPPGPL